MQPIFVRGELRGFLAAGTVIIATLGLAHGATACPNDIPIQRALSGPYSAVWDHRITNSPGIDPEHLDPSGGKNASLALSDNGIIAVAYERPDPNNAPGNALSLQRFNINFNLPGECVCDLACVAGHRPRGRHQSANVGGRGADTHFAELRALFARSIK